MKSGGTLTRVFPVAEPFSGDRSRFGWGGRGTWPARWIGCAQAGDPPLVVAYRLRVRLARPARLRLHLTADERYDFFLDGRHVARGSERGDRNNWFYESWDLALPAGSHTLVARVWAQGDQAAFAQMALRPGFLLAAEGSHADRFNTGTARWEAKRLGGYGFRPPDDAWGTGWNLDINGAAFDWDHARGGGTGWRPVTVLGKAGNASGANEWTPAHLLRPAQLPPMLDSPRQSGRVRLVEAMPTLATRGRPVEARHHLGAEAGVWQDLVSGRGSVTIPARTKRRVIVDLDDYVCARPVLVTTGGRGAQVRVHWEEGLYEGAPDPKNWLRHRPKGNRNEIEGKYFVGVGDVFRPDGGRARRFDTLWWQAGRYLEIAVETGNQPLTLNRFALRETRYPLTPESRFATHDTRLLAPIPIMQRALQMCSHETYMDCPYYEQLMYVGDTRLEVLATYATTRDDRLPRKAITLFNESRLISGFTQSRYPSRIRQVIPPFSLWWIGMVYDFALWLGDRQFVQAQMPGVRAVLDAFKACLNADGLVEAPNGWNYMDWVPAWRDGCPPDGDLGVSGVINWQFALILSHAAELEAWVGEPELAARNRRLAAEVGRRTAKAFWSARRGILADDFKHRRFSEHSQCLALLSGQLPPAYRAKVTKGLFDDPDLERTTIYFSHYLLETCRLTGRMDKFFARLQQWFDLPALGFKTTLEHPEPSRSDCHAWGAHPLYHYLASILGIRPARLGGRDFIVSPQLGPLNWASGSFPLPQGDLKVEVRREGGRIHGSVSAPRGLRAVFRPR